MFHRIRAIILRYLYLFRHSLDRVSDSFYWPVIDLLLWGITSYYIKESFPDAALVLLMIVSGILFWIIVWRGQYEISVNLLEELWNKNLVNLFVTPLRFGEWIISFLIIGVIKALLSFSFASLVAFILYQTGIFYLGFYMIPFMILLIMSGWWIGFGVAGLILRFGTKVQSFAWMLVMIFSPFSAIYYPLSILPDWAQRIAAFVPTSYVFEGIREVLYTGSLDWSKVLYSLGLNLIYLILMLIFLRRSFAKILNRGLVKIY